MSARTHGPRASPAAADGRERLAAAAEAIAWLVLFATAFALSPTARDAFRLPKLMLGEWLVLASLIPLALTLRRLDRVRLADVWGLPAFRATLPLVVVATVGLAFTAHPGQTSDGLVDLWIGAAALVGWSAGLGTRRLERLLGATLVPATLLAVLGILQFHGIYRPFGFVGEEETGRFGITALAGNPGDLAGLLALACLVAQAVVARTRPEGGGKHPAALRGAALAALAICLYGLVLTQTLTAVAATAAGTLVFWAIRSTGRRRAVAGIAAAVVLAAAFASTVGPLASRAATLRADLEQGRLNEVLTGRLDGWRAAAWMAGENPWAGVGHSAYVAEFGPARLALQDRGVEFYPGHAFPYFANAHNELLEVAAELGWPGLAALGWGLAVVGLCAWRTSRREAADAGSGNGDRRQWSAATAWGGLTVVAVLSLGQFPFHVATIAFPAIVLLAWICRPLDAAPREADGRPGGTAVRGGHLAWPLAALLVAGLAMQTTRAVDLLRASRIQHAVEEVTRIALRSGRAQPELLWTHVRLLDGAAALDPTSAGVGQALGVQYLLLGRLDEAETSMRRALALEPRPETWLNLGRVLWADGRRREASEAFAKAVRLNPRLTAELPPEAAEGGG